MIKDIKKDAKVVAIIQARTGSTRLPCKVLMPIVGKPMLWHVIDRLKHCKSLNSIVVATTNKETDKQVLELAEESGVETFAGSESDVLDRYYQTAKKFGADIIVRITSDCPLIDPDIIDRLVVNFKASKADYMHTGSSFPEGVDTEVFSFNALETSWKEAEKQYEREHVTMYIHCHLEKFRIASLENESDMSHIRFTVDTAKDIVVVKKIFENLYREGNVFHMQEVIDFLQKHPEITKINKDTPRNAGFLASLRKEGIDITDSSAPCSEWINKYAFHKKKEGKK